MGSACCVAVRARSVRNGSGGDVVVRNDRYSPSWSFRWDNRGRVAGEELSVNCFSDAVGMNDRLDDKSHTTVETSCATEEGSPLDSFRSLTWQKSSPSEENVVSLSGPLNSKNLPKGKELRETPTPVASEPSPSPPKMSTSMHSVSSFSASPLSSSQGYLLPPPRWPRRSPGHHLLRQVSDSRIPGMMSPNFSISEESSPFMRPGWSNKSNRGSRGGSSDGWSMPSFSELMEMSNRERWSFDSESFGFSRDRVSRSSGRVSSSPSVDMQTCGVCSKLLAEKSSWAGQKIVATNGLSVVAILICGHVYHAECLEHMTPEINKYDPACPVCTFGEKKVLKLSEKALGVETDLKAKIGKKLRSRVVDGDIGDDSVMFDRHKSMGHEGRGPRMGSSSSMKSSIRRHLSFGSKWNRSLSENGSRKKGFLWTKSSKQ